MVHTKNHDQLLRFSKLTNNAYSPSKATPDAAGFDLYSAYDYVVPAHGKVLAHTDIQIAVPHDCYGRVTSRSSIVNKNFIDVAAGVIDRDYRGNVGVVLLNFGTEKFKVNKGDRIAQLICERIAYPEIQECKTLEETERGASAFGLTASSGINKSRGDTLHAGEQLASGERLESSNGVYTACMQPDGLFVIYKDGHLVEWHSNTLTNGDTLVMQHDGNLVVYKEGKPTWASMTNGTGCNHLTMQSDGNLVIYSDKNEQIWASKSSKGRN